MGKSHDVHKCNAWTSRAVLVLKRYIYLVTIKSSTEYILIVEDGSDFK